jgi:hypothetical protein
MLTSRWLLLALFAFGFGGLTKANVIDFETGSFILGIGQTGTLDRFNFTTGGQSSSFLAVPVMPGSCIPSCISNGTLSLGAFNGATMMMDPIIPDDIFSLQSFDVAGTATAGSTRNVTSLRVIGNLFGGGQVIQTFVVMPDVFQTLTLNSSFAGLSSVEFDGLLPIGLNSPEFQLDNITYNLAAAVPEPSSRALVAAVLLAAMLATAGRKLSLRALP